MLYQYRCVCGNIQELIRRFDRRDFNLECDKCGKRMERIQIPKSEVGTKIVWKTEK